MNFNIINEELARLKIEYEKEKRELEEEIRTLKFEKETIETYTDERIAELENIIEKTGKHHHNCKCNCKHDKHMSLLQIYQENEKLKELLQHANEILNKCYYVRWDLELIGEIKDFKEDIQEFS